MTCFGLKDPTLKQCVCVCACMHAHARAHTHTHRVYMETDISIPHDLYCFVGIYSKGNSLENRICITMFTERLDQEYQYKINTVGP
jgi:hypothetical protein